MMNPNLISISDSTKLMMTAILDPESGHLPDIVSNGWTNLHDTYKLSRDFVYNLHKKREKLTELKSKVVDILINQSTT